MSLVYQTFKIERPVHVPTPELRFLGHNISEVIPKGLEPTDHQEDRENGLRTTDTFRLEDGTTIVRKQFSRNVDDAAPYSTNMTATTTDGKVTQLFAYSSGVIHSETEVREGGQKKYTLNDIGGIELSESGTAVEDPAGIRDMKFVIHEEGQSYVEDNELGLAAGEMTRVLSDTTGDGFFDREVYSFSGR
jgi:hypothetical protein